MFRWIRRLRVVDYFAGAISAAIVELVLMGAMAAFGNLKDLRPIWIEMGILFIPVMLGCAWCFWGFRTAEE